MAKIQKSGSPLIIGVDVGGTNTDAVIIKNTEVICSAKSPTTPDVTSGLAAAISLVINELPEGFSGDDIQRVNIGTTHFVNAVIQRKDIVQVGVLRLCGPASHSVPPFSDFPNDLKRVVAGPYYILKGGYEFDGKNKISEVDDNEIKQVVAKITGAGIRNVVVAGVFSPVCSDQEDYVSKLIKRCNPGISVTKSHDVGLLGFLERENASILNESLKPLCSRTVRAFCEALKDIGLKCPFYLTQNDGTIISAKEALKFPVFTFASGPTNSMRGATHLSSIKDAIVVDIGGTSTDVGVICNGFPRLSSTRVKVGGVNTNFRMPDVFSIGLGGGSHVKENTMGHISIGPESVGYKLNQDAKVFGGDILTATDIAVAASLCKLGDKTKVQDITQEFKDRSLKTIKKMVEDAIDQVKISKEDQPVILVGGGAVLINQDWQLKGASRFEIPDYHQAANAVGAALSKVSGIIDKVFNLENQSEEEAKQKAEAAAHQKAVDCGAEPSSIVIMDKTAVKLAYLPGNVIRIQVKAIGDLAEGFQDNIESQQLEFDDLPVLPPRTVLFCADTCSPPTSTEPYIDPATGDWILSEYDVECIAIGAGILGCGGGGSPYIGKLRIKQLIKSGKKIRVMHPDRLGKSAETSGAVGMVAFMGAPLILIEKLPSGLETASALKAIRQQVISEERGTAQVTPLSAIVCGEVGGLNSLEPFAVAADLGLPVVDADGMGRAFPELQMFLPFVFGCRPYPAGIADEKGNVLVMSKVLSAKGLENFFRVVCVQMGCAAGISIIFSIEDMKKTNVLYSLSRARGLGNVILQARKDKANPIETILSSEQGKLLLSGKVKNVERETIQGFNKGTITIEETSEQSKTLFVEFQNENYLAYYLNNGIKDIQACVPDLISLVDSESGEPIPTEEVRYGLRVAVLAISCNPLWRTPEGLSAGGPEAFGYNDVPEHIVHSSVGEYKQNVPIPKPGPTMG